MITHTPSGNVQHAQLFMRSTLSMAGIHLFAFYFINHWRQIGNYTRAGQVNGSDVEKWND